jgi:hypothetical protein
VNFWVIINFNFEVLQILLSGIICDNIKLYQRKGDLVESKIHKKEFIDRLRFIPLGIVKKSLDGVA